MNACGTTAPLVAMNLRYVWPAVQPGRRDQHSVSGAQVRNRSLEKRVAALKERALSLRRARFFCVVTVSAGNVSANLQRDNRTLVPAPHRPRCATRWRMTGQ
jgi:hypothetical protein